MWGYGDAKNYCEVVTVDKKIKQLLKERPTLKKYNSKPNWKIPEGFEEIKYQDCLDLLGLLRKPID